MGVIASGCWGHQLQGVSPKVLKTIRLQAAQIAGRVATGSVEVALEMGARRVKDPKASIVQQHFKAVVKVFWACSEVEFINRMWEHLSAQLKRHDRWKVVCGPMGAMISYLYDLRVEAPSTTQ